MFVCLFGFLTSSSTTRLYRGRAPRQERLTILRAATHKTELGDHDFCLSRSHYTDTDPTCRERAATAGIEPGTSSPGVARSTAPPVWDEQNLSYELHSMDGRLNLYVEPLSKLSYPRTHHNRIISKAVNILSPDYRREKNKKQQQRPITPRQIQKKYM